MLITTSIGFANRQDTFRLSGLFADGTPGTLPSGDTFQDVAGTTSAGVGDPVALALDESGNNSNLIQDVNDDKRPTNDGAFFALDGIDDFLAARSLDLTSATAVTVIMAVSSKGAESPGRVLEFSEASGANAGSFSILMPGREGLDSITISGHGTIVQELSVTGITLSDVNIVTAIFDIGTSEIILRVNGVEVASSVEPLGAGNFGQYDLFFGAKAGTSKFLDGNIGREAILIGKRLTANEITKAESAVAKAAGVSL